MSFKSQNLNIGRTRKWGGGGGGKGGGWPPPRVFLFFFFLDDKTSKPQVFYSYSFIPRTHFEKSLKMVSYYGYEI